MTGNDDRFVARARAVFDRGVESIDGSTRSRLTQARYAAVAELGRATAWRSPWVPATAAAAAAVLAVALWLQPGDPGQAPPSPQRAAVPTDDFELLAMGEDLDLLGEDLEFYAWAAQAESDNGIG